MRLTRQDKEELKDVFAFICVMIAIALFTYMFD